MTTLNNRPVATIVEPTNQARIRSVFLQKSRWFLKICVDVTFKENSKSTNRMVFLIIQISVYSALYQYPIIRPAVIAVSQQKRETPPATANCDCSRGDRSRVLRSFQPDKEFKTRMFNRPRPIAGNLM